MKRDIGELLVENGQITDEELQQALQKAESATEPTGRILLRLGLVSEDNLKTVLELNYGVNFLDLKKMTPIPNISALVPKEIVLQSGIVPVAVAGNRLTLAMVMPSDDQGLAILAPYVKDWQLNKAVCSDDGFADFVIRAYPSKEKVQISQPVADPAFGGQTGVVIGQELKQGVDEGRAIVLLTQHILANAITKGCTNIHIEPGERQILVHYRKEGVLFSARKLPRSILPELVQRFKTMVSKGGVGPALPYDGLLNVRHEEKNFSFRLSIVPGTYGEHLVIWLE